LRATSTGIGTALKAARESKGISLERASRDTRIHSTYLQALERESFQSLRADVYARGFLRSYSSYLGLDPDRVITAYERVVPPKPAAPAPPAPQDEKRDLGAPRHGPHWRLVAAVAVGLLVVFGAAGLLTRTGSPTTKRLPIAVSPQATAPDAVTVRLLTPDQPARALVIADGVRRFTGNLPIGTPQRFTAQGLLRIELRPGGVVDVRVNGHELGRPGDAKALYEASFTSQDFRGTPSASA